jgi:hypothetical protein
MTVAASTKWAAQGHPSLNALGLPKFEICVGISPERQNRLAITKVDDRDGN